MDKELGEYELDELEKACLNEHNATGEYRRRLEKELKKELEKNPELDWTPLYDELQQEEENLIDAIEYEIGFTIPYEYQEKIMNKVIKQGHL